MIKANQTLINRLNMILDLLLLSGSYIAVTALDYTLSDAPELLNIFLNTRALIIALSCFMLECFAFWIAGLYSHDRLKSLRQEMLKQFVIHTAAFLLMNNAQILVLPRRGLLMIYLVSTFLLLLKQASVTLLMRHYRNLGFNIKHCLIVGNGHLAHEYCKSLQENPEYGFQVCGYLAKTDREGLGPRLGLYEDLSEVLGHSAGAIDEVIVALEPTEVSFTATIISVCEKWGVKVRIIPFYNDYIPYRAAIDEIGSTHLIALRSAPLDDAFNQAVKNVFDFVLSLILILITSPIMLVAAIGIKLTSPGPVIFAQQRIGLNRKPFTMYKFRTMHVNKSQDTGWTTDADQRKTAWGSLLRKFSIDELPQFFNVLKGEMSLIGPRPEVPYYVEQFKDKIPKYMVKHQVKPGITGWAQVNGYRGDTSIEDRIRYDLYYIDHWSLGLDLKILFKTVFGGICNKEKLFTGNCQKDIKIAVATHKPYWMPQDPMYLPMQAGNALHPSSDYAGDDTGDNISAKNPGYCELTCLYWMWKNMPNEVLGLVHYRRHFRASRLIPRRTRSVLSQYQLQGLLVRTDVILPKKRHYIIETNATQYARAHHEKDLKIVRQIISERTPAYLSTFDHVMRQRSGHRFNMMIMKRTQLDAYCSWLFPILEEAEKRIDTTRYDKYNQRVYGFLGERLLDVWIQHNEVRFLELPWISLESQHWPSKISRFLIRHFRKTNEEINT